jgi:hypothetical protein
MGPLALIAAGVGFDAPALLPRPPRVVPPAALVVPGDLAPAFAVVGEVVRALVVVIGAFVVAPAAPPLASGPWLAVVEVVAPVAFAAVPAPVAFETEAGAAFAGAAFAGAEVFFWAAAEPAIVNDRTNAPIATRNIEPKPVIFIVPSSGTAQLSTVKPATPRC